MVEEVFIFLLLEDVLKFIFLLYGDRLRLMDWNDVIGEEWCDVSGVDVMNDVYGVLMFGYGVVVIEIFVSVVR